MEALTSLILAAGKGTRMPSPRPKVLQTLLGESMLALVTIALHNLEPCQKIFTLVGSGAAEVYREVEDVATRLDREALILKQQEQLGTGHALVTALPHLPEQGHILVVNGDTPLITTATLELFLKKAWGADVAFLSLELDDTASYGRVIRKNSSVRAIVEARDFDPALYGSTEVTQEVNTGIYLFSLPAVRSLTPRLNKKNKSGEYYITDLVSLGVSAGMDVRGIGAEGAGCEPMSLLGVNTPAELAEAEALLKRRQSSSLLASGVILHEGSLIRVSPFSHVEAGAELFGPCEISGDSFVEKGAIVRSHNVIKNSVIHSGAEIREFCHIESAEICKGAIIGPYARLRPGTLIDEDAHAGSFVEIKKTHLGKGAKANHLTYLGDSDVGSYANIGAGTITCNYDGVKKHRTVIGANSFIGSNTAFVAPVSVGEGALVGAGSVIVEDVPPRTLALGRSRQVIKPLEKKRA